MEPLEIAKQTLHLSKVTFDNTYDAMLLLQEQSQRLIDIYLEQMVAFRDEGKKIADTLMESCRTNGKEFKKTLENDCAICASFLYDAEKKSEN
jgi:hypothetical protein